jgi:type II secretory pathway component PulM
MMQITPRERLLAAGLIAAVAFWALYTLAVRPATARIRTLQRVVPEKQAQLQELESKIAQYLALREKLSQARTQMASRQPDFQLLPFLEATIDRHKLAAHIVTMERDALQPKPDYSEVVVTLELREVSLKELIEFLSDVQNNTALARIGTLHIRQDTRDEALLDSTIGIHSPRLSPPALVTQTPP